MQLTPFLQSPGDLEARRKCSSVPACQAQPEHYLIEDSFNKGSQLQLTSKSLAFTGGLGRAQHTKLDWGMESEEEVLTHYKGTCLVAC